MAEQMQGTEQTERAMGGDVAPPLPKSMMPGGDPGDVRGELGTKLVRRRLMTTDVWHLIRILGRISKDARERVLASEGNAGQVDVLGLFLTEGVDKAQAEINGWFADLTGIPAGQIDSQEIGF